LGLISKCSFVDVHISFFSVLANAKGPVADVVWILIFRKSVTVMGILGYAIIAACVVLYGETKRRNKL
jgi:hypothetical protein